MRTLALKCVLIKLPALFAFVCVFRKDELLAINITQTGVEARCIVG